VRASRLIEALIVVVGVATVAHAHTLGISSGEYRASGSRLVVHLAFAASDAALLVPALDGDGDGRVAAAEVVRARPAIDGAMRSFVVVSGDGDLCGGHVTDAALTEGDGVIVDATFTCAHEPAGFDLAFPGLSVLGPSHRHVARTIGTSTADALLTADTPHVAFVTRTGEPRTPEPASSSRRWLVVVGLVVAFVGAALVRRARRRPHGRG
jgi:hypothetical protein